MKEYYKVEFRDSGELIIEETDSDLWLNELYTGGNKEYSCTGTYCKIKDLEKAKRKVINSCLKDAKIQYKKAKENLDKIKSQIEALNM